METTTQSIGLNRLKEALAFWETLKPEQFYFGWLVGKPDALGCESIHCLLGWLPAIFPEEFKFTETKLACDRRTENYVTATEASRWFGIERREAKRLFCPEDKECPLDDNATLSQALDNVRAFIAEKEAAL